MLLQTYNAVLSTVIHSSGEKPKHCLSTGQCEKLSWFLRHRHADPVVRTLDDGVEGDHFHTPSVVVEGKVPHPWFQILDEAGLVESHRVIQPGLRVHVARSAVLFGDESAPVQQLHKVILQNKKSRCSSCQSHPADEGALCMQPVSSSLQSFPQDTARSVLWAQQLLKCNKSWFLVAVIYIW